MAIFELAFYVLSQHKTGEFIMAWQFRLGYALLITLVWLSTALAITFVFENVDTNDPPADPPDVEAGDLPINASETERRARVVSDRIDLDDELMQVIGRIESASDIDMYYIHISIPDEFSATTIFAPGVTIEDSQLFLFDENGRGVCANEDNPSLPATDPFVFFAALPQGFCGLPSEPGFYHLAVSTSVRDPVDADGDEIFPDPALDERQQLLEPQSSQPVVDWVDPSGIGNYALQLTGVNFPFPDCLGAEQAEPETINGDRGFSRQVQDDELGIESITVIKEINIDEVILPNLTNAPLTPVTIQAIQADPFLPSSVEVEVTNTRGLSTTCTLRVDPADDLIAPKCTDVFNLEGVPSIETTARDDESGISRIEIDFINNATVTVDGDPLPAANGDRFIAFTPPTKDEVLIRAEKIDLDRRATVILNIFDNAFPVPNVIKCDPILFRLVVPDDGNTVQQTFTDIPEENQYITVQNGNGIPGGLLGLSIQVNNAPAHEFKLGPGEVIQLNVAGEIIPGLNTMTFKGMGVHGANANIAIANQPSELAPVTAPGAIPRSGSSRSFNYLWGR